MAKVVLTHTVSNGGGSTPSNDFMRRVTTPLPVATPTTADEVPTSTCSFVKWNYTIADDDEDKFHTAEIVATHRNGTNPTHSRYGLIGDTIPHSVNVVSESGLLKLQFTNLDAHDVVVNVLRTLLTTP